MASERLQTGVSAAGSEMVASTPMQGSHATMLPISTPLETNSRLEVEGDDEAYRDRAMRKNHRDPQSSIGIDTCNSRRTAPTAAHVPRMCELGVNSSACCRDRRARMTKHASESSRDEAAQIPKDNEKYRPCQDARPRRATSAFGRSAVHHIGTGRGHGGEAGNEDSEECHHHDQDDRAKARVPLWNSVPIL